MSGGGLKRVSYAPVQGSVEGDGRRSPGGTIAWLSLSGRVPRIAQRVQTTGGDATMPLGIHTMLASCTDDGFETPDNSECSEAPALDSSVTLLRRQSSLRMPSNLSSQSLSDSSCDASYSTSGGASDSASSGASDSASTSTSTISSDISAVHSDSFVKRKQIDLSRRTRTASLDAVAMTTSVAAAPMPVQGAAAAAASAAAAAAAEPTLPVTFTKIIFKQNASADQPWTVYKVPNEAISQFLRDRLAFACAFESVTDTASIGDKIVAKLIACYMLDETIAFLDRPDAQAYLRKYSERLGVSVAGVWRRYAVTDANFESTESYKFTGWY